MGTLQQQLQTNDTPARAGFIVAADAYPREPGNYLIIEAVKRNQLRRKLIQTVNSGHPTLFVDAHSFKVFCRGALLSPGHEHRAAIQHHHYLL